jgi:hypothetical protein
MLAILLIFAVIAKEKLTKQRVRLTSLMLIDASKAPKRKRSKTTKSSFMSSLVPSGKIFVLFVTGKGTFSKYVLLDLPPRPIAGYTEVFLSQTITASSGNQLLAGSRLGGFEGTAVPKPGRVVFQAFYSDVQLDQFIVDDHPQPLYAIVATLEEANKVFALTLLKSRQSSRRRARANLLQNQRMLRQDLRMLSSY